MSLVETYLQTNPQKFALWPSVWKLLRLRMRIWWNGLIRSKLRHKISMGVLLSLLVGVMVFLFIASGWLLSFIQSPRLAEYIDPAQFLGAIPTMVLTLAFFLTLMTNFGLLLQALYLSRDMDFLVTTPIPMRAVFLSKLLEAILPNFALFCAFSLPVLFGLGVSGGYSLLYFPLLLVMLALLALAAGGLAAILVMAVVRVVPAKRVAEVLGVLGALASVLCGQTGNLISVTGLKGADMRGVLGAFSSLNAPWSPLAWAGRGLTGVGRGDWLPGLGLSVLALALAAALFTGTLFLVEQLYYSGWASMQGSVGKRKKARNYDAGLAAGGMTQPSSAVPGIPSEAGRHGASRLLPTPLRGMIVKDFLILRRDPRNMSQLITPLILGIVMLFTTAGGGRNTEKALSELRINNLDVYGMILLALFVGWMLMINLATMAFSREGRNYWLLKAAPIRPAYLMLSKFVVSFLPAAAFSLAYLLVGYVIRRISLGSYAYSALIVALVMAGATGIALAFGVAGANLEWDSPQRQRLKGTTGCVVYIVVTVFVVLELGLFLAPPILWQVFSGTTPLIATLLGVILGGVVAVLCAVLPLWGVMPRLARIGEPE